MSDIVKEITDRMKTFRDLLLLPKPKDLDFDNWLENFHNPNEKEIAAHILNHWRIQLANAIEF